MKLMTAGRGALDKKESMMSDAQEMQVFSHQRVSAMNLPVTVLLLVGWYE